MRKRRSWPSSNRSTASIPRWRTSSPSIRGTCRVEEGAMKRTLTTLFAVCLGLAALAQSALAIPAFAKKYGTNCNMCHVAFTKLNDFGQRYRDNGYQIPGQQGYEKTIFEAGIIPLALRTTAGYSLYDGGGQTAGGF